MNQLSREAMAGIDEGVVQVRADDYDEFNTEGKLDVVLGRSRRVRIS